MTFDLDANLYVTVRYQSLFRMGQMDESLPHFYRALAILGAEQPTHDWMLPLLLPSHLTQQWKHLQWPAKYLGRTTWVNYI